MTKAKRDTYDHHSREALRSMVLQAEDYSNSLRAENDRLRRELQEGAAENAAMREALTYYDHGAGIAHTVLATPGPRASQLLAVVEAARIMLKAMNVRRLRDDGGIWYELENVRPAELFAALEQLDGAALDARGKEPSK